MKSGLDLSLEILATTANEAAAGVLLCALGSPQREIQRGAIEAILARRSPRGLRELVARWDTFNADFQSLIVAQRGRLAAAIRDAICSPHRQLCRNGCRLAQAAGEYEIIPALVNVVTSGEAAHAEIAAASLLNLSQVLHNELVHPGDWRKRHDPQIARPHIITALETATRRFADHQRTEIVNAFLILAGRDNGTLKRILRQPLDRAYPVVINLLTHSRRPAIVQLAVSFLEDPRAPQAALTAIAQRNDDEFVIYLLHKIGQNPSSEVRHNLSQLTNIKWLTQNHRRLKSLDAAAQCAVIQVTLHSGMPQADKLEVFKTLLAGGQPAARRAAAVALEEFTGVDANRLVLQALRDGDVQVQAAALAQLRSRKLPGAMGTLIDALDSPHELLQQAARSSLEEFNFARYLKSYESMSDDVRRSTGQLVRKVDVNTRDLLQSEMESNSRQRRMRALEVALSLDMLAELETTVHRLLQDDDHFVRLEAIRVMAESPTEKTRLALRDATLDESPVVRDAAQQALDEMVTAAVERPAAINLPTNIDNRLLRGNTASADAGPGGSS